tara:strand:+ start:1139 stop:2131 length:993 start_codon:yes stop_codon:yes gene_type:complete
MADKVRQFTIYRIKNLDRAEQEYYRTLQRTLDKIENDVVALAGRELPTQKGKLIELQAAVAIRPKIRTILQTEFLGWADTVTKKGFNRQAKRIERAFRTIGNIPEEFLVLTKGDLELVKNLKLQTFTQFKDISNTFTKRLADKIYQDTLVGREFVELEKELRQTINGIYSKTNDKEAQKLVNFVKRNKNVKSMQSRVDKAVATLQSKFGRDRAGDNMRRYSSQLLNDGLREFDAQVNAKKSLDAGLTHVKYFGDIIPETRRICRDVLSGVYRKRKSNLFTIDEVRKLWTQQSWNGKKPGDPLVVRGGYNCRHQWTYVNPDWYDANGQLII